jgi:hypothetical protein
MVDEDIELNGFFGAQQRKSFLPGSGGNSEKNSSQKETTNTEINTEPKINSTMYSLCLSFFLI